MGQKWMWEEGADPNEICRHSDTGMAEKGWNIAENKEPKDPIRAHNTKHWTKSRAIPTASQQRDHVVLQQHEKGNEERLTRDEAKAGCRALEEGCCRGKRSLLNPKRQRIQRIRSQHCQRDHKHDEQQVWNLPWERKIKALHLLARNVLFSKGDTQSEII